MATLTVTITTNYSNQSLNDIDLIRFLGGGNTTATFGSAQFGTGLISNNVQIRGDGFSNAIIVNLASGATFSAAGWTFLSWTGADTLTFNGSTGNDTITGSARADTLIGNGGNDTLSGGAGDDNLRGLSGNDTINGGDGIDEVRYDRDEAAGGTAGVTVNLATGTATDGFGHTDTLSGIEMVRGTSKADTLTGGNAASDAFEAFRGLAGNDTIDGGSGYDEVRYDMDAVYGGTAGVTVNLATGTATDGFGHTDTLRNIEGVRGTLEADTFVGSAGNNDFFGLAGDDTITGGGGFDTVRYDVDAAFGGTAGVTVDLGAGTATDGFGDTDTLNGIQAVIATSFADTLTGTDFVGLFGESFAGLAGSDTIRGGLGYDEVRYDRDAAAGGTAGVTVNLATGTATDGFGNADTLNGIEIVRGTNQSDTITGNGLDNLFRGLGGDDVFDGGEGHDVVAYDLDASMGGTGGVNVDLAAGIATDGFGNIDSLTSIEGVRGTNQNDTLTGSEADNSFAGLGGNDTILGGGGMDEVRYDLDVLRGGGAGVTVNLATGTATDGFGDTDTLSGIEIVRATRFNDTLTGSDADEIFRPLGGNDTVSGGGGIDWIDYSQDIFARESQSQAFAGVTVNLATGTATDGFGGTDTLSGIENIAGGGLNDTLTGNGEANVFRGYGGNDIINGGDGVDTVDYSHDHAYGLLIFANGAAGVTVNLGAGTAVDGFGDTDTLVSIENVIGTAFDDTLVGGAGANRLEGGEGDDRLDGGAGADTLIGGAGDDIYTVDDAGDVVIEEADGGFDVVLAAASWSLAAGQEIEVLRALDPSAAAAINLVGNELAQRLEGNAGANVLNGGGGADIMQGFGGDDTYVVDHEDDQIIEVAGGGTDTVMTGLSFALAENQEIEILQTLGINTTAAINLTGNGFAQTLIGNRAANVLNGRGGADIMRGFGGNDIYYVDDAGDQVFEAVGAGTDTVFASTSWVLAAGQEVEVIQTTGIATRTAINLTGNEFAQTLYGNAGANVLNGGGGADIMQGFGGDDTYIVDDAGDQVIEAAGGGTDTVMASVSYALTAGASIEVLRTMGVATRAAINLTGNELAQTLYGNAANNILDGGGGADIMQGFGGNDTYYVDHEGDQVIEAVGGGTDRVLTSVSYALAAGSEVEVLEALDPAASAALTLVGNAFDQTLLGNAGDNVLNGRGGADIMRGFAGDDIYYVDDAGDQVFEAAGEGFDTVMASVSYALAADQEIEVLQTTGIATTANINLTGNGFAQTLNGNAGNNVLNGAGGADILRGYGGDDTYFVDHEGDQVFEAVGGGTDTVFTSVSYTLAAHAAIEVLQTMGVSTTANISLIGNGFAQTLNGNRGNNILNGGGGADIMRGFAGDDTYVVDHAGDQVFEAVGAGTDTVIASVSYALAAGQEIEVLRTAGIATTTAIDLTGNEFAQTIYGNAGANVIRGGAGNDVLWGFGGADAFVFDTALNPISNVDTIADFTVGVDKIHLDNAIFAALGAAGALNADVLRIGASAQDGDDYLIYNAETGALFYDADGNGSGAAVRFATIGTNLALTSTDFLVI